MKELLFISLLLILFVFLISSSKTSTGGIVVKKVDSKKPKIGAAPQAIAAKRKKEKEIKK